MLLREWLNENDSLFQAISDKFSGDIFSQNNPQVLDNVYALFHGNREVASTIEDKGVDFVANIITNLYKYKWETEYALRYEEMMIGIDKKEETEENSSGNRTTDTDNTSTHKVSAFNVDEMSPDNEDDNTGNETTDKEDDRSMTVTTKTYETVKDQLNTLNKSFITDTVFYDLNSVLTLSINGGH